MRVPDIHDQQGHVHIHAEELRRAIAADTDDLVRAFETVGDLTLLVEPHPVAHREAWIRARRRLDGVGSQDERGSSIDADDAAECASWAGLAEDARRRTSSVQPRVRA